MNESVYARRELLPCQFGLPLNDAAYNLPFRSISERQNELQDQEENISVFQEVVDNRCRIVTKGPSFILIGTARSSNKIHDNRSGEPERSYMNVSQSLQYNLA